MSDPEPASVSMGNRLFPASFAAVLAFGCHTACAQPPTPCGQLMLELMSEYAKEGGYFLTMGSDKATGVQTAGFVKGDRIYMEIMMPPDHPPPTKDCPSTPPLRASLVFVGECLGPGPSGMPVAFKHWRCTGSIPGK